MSKVIAGMTVSLGGFVGAAAGSAGALYPDLDELQDAPYIQAMKDETGAVLMGRRTFDMAGTRTPTPTARSFRRRSSSSRTPTAPTAPTRNERLWFTFVMEGVHAAVAQAAEAAGERAVTVVGGADLNRQLLAVGLVDELRVDVMPVLLGGGLRLFDGVGPHTLEKLGIDDVGGRTSLRFRVLKGG